MSQNYPVYQVIHGTTLPITGAQVEVYVAQQASPGPPYTWLPAPADPNNLAVTQSNANIPGNVYVVGSGNGNGTYANAAAAEAAAIAYAQSLETARDRAAAIRNYSSGDAAAAIALSADSPVFGPG